MGFLSDLFKDYLVEQKWSDYIDHIPNQCKLIQLKERDTISWEKYYNDECVYWGINDEDKTRFFLYFRSKEDFFEKTKEKYEQYLISCKSWFGFQKNQEIQIIVNDEGLEKETRIDKTKILILTKDWKGKFDFHDVGLLIVDEYTWYNKHKKRCYDFIPKNCIYCDEVLHKIEPWNKVGMNIFYDRTAGGSICYDKNHKQLKLDKAILQF